MQRSQNIPCTAQCDNAQAIQHFPGSLGRWIPAWVWLGVWLGCASLGWGQNLQVLYAFTNGVDGAGPRGITLNNDTIYGVSFGKPTVFSIKTNGTAFTVIHAFNTNDGHEPYGAPLLVGNTLYGTTLIGGGSAFNPGGGTIYKVDVNGANFATLHTFTYALASNSTNSDGTYPWPSPILVGNKLYGTTAVGGTYGNGTIYSINLDGSGFTVLYAFPDGGNNDSCAKLVASGTKLYGTTRYGGANSKGRIFSINTDGTGFTTLHSFAFDADGYGPEAGLILSGTTLYGTTAIGAGVYGSVYKINTDGSGFARIYGFMGYPNDSRSVENEPVLIGNQFYGVSWGGGASDQGTLYSVKTDGTGYTLMQSFSQSDTNGYNLQAPLLVSGNYLYGTTARGGGPGRSGTIFSYKYSNCDPGSLAIALYSGLTLTGSVGCTYNIEWRGDNNLSTPWNLLTTVTLTNSPFLFIDPTPVQSNRYYRAVTQ